MKCRELEVVLEATARLVETCGGRPTGASILTQFLRKAPERTVMQLAKVVCSAKPESQTTVREPVDDARDFVDAVGVALKAVAKATVISDLTALSNALRQHAGCDAQALLLAVDDAVADKKPVKVSIQVDESVVRKHITALEQALGDDDGFAMAVRRLQDDPQAGVAEVVAISKRFAFASTKSRAAALKKINARHQSLMTSRAKAAATAGRIAG